MKGKATILCENCVFGNVGAIAEHGWAVFIETNQGNFLFDTGQGKAIINNAQYFTPKRYSNVSFVSSFDNIAIFKKVWMRIHIYFPSFF